MIIWPDMILKPTSAFGGTCSSLVHICIVSLQSHHGRVTGLREGYEGIFRWQLETVMTMFIPGNLAGFKNPGWSGWLFDIGDCTTQLGIIINQCKDLNKPISIMECHSRVLKAAQLWTEDALLLKLQNAWNPNGAPCFAWKRPCFGGVKAKNRGQTGSTWRIIPFSKWLVTPIYKPFSPFGRGISLLKGLSNHGF